LNIFSDRFERGRSLIVRPSPRPNVPMSNVRNRFD
jgi:hypothetical protein